MCLSKTYAFRYNDSNDRKKVEGRSMTAKRNRHKQSVQPKVIEIATRKYLAIAIVITFLLSVILTVIQIVSLSGYTSHLADTGARQ